MELSQLAYVARVKGNLDEARSLASEALVFERLAADMVPMTDRAEPTRSILYRSAASLALQAGDHSECRRLVGEGLRGNPPENVALELGDVLSTLRSFQYMESKSLTTAPTSLFLRLVGKAIHDGSVAVDEFVNRTSAIKSLVRRLSERKEQIKFSAQGAPRKQAKNITAVLSGIQTGSFVAHFDFVVSNEQLSLLSQVDDVVGDVIQVVEIAQSGDQQDLLDFTSNDSELAKNLITSIRTLAPDGEGIDEVNLISGTRSARITQPRQLFTPKLASVIASDSEESETGLVIEGYIDAAFKGKNTIKIIPSDGGRPVSLHVSDGLTEMVETFWREPSLVIVYDSIEGHNQLVVMDPAPFI